MTPDVNSDSGGYSEIADRQLDDLAVADVDLYTDIVTVCEAILTDPARAQSMSAAIRTDHGIRFRFAVPGRHPYKVFWSSEGPRIEAVFPYS